MTNDEACKWLANLRRDIGNPHYECLWVYEQAICEIMSMLEEQEPKAVKIKKNAYNHEFYYCPRCDRGFEDFFRKPMFCGKCGQEVKWDEVD